MDEKQKGEEVVLFKNTKFGKWLDNFWYHYKVQTIICFFLLFAITICVVQCSTNNKNQQIQICYAGPTSFQETSTNTIKKDLNASFTQIYNHSYDIYSYYIDVNNQTTLTQQNITNLKDDFDLGTTFIYLLDKTLFDSYSTLKDGNHYMVQLASYASSSSLVFTEDGYGVYLNSTSYAALPGFQDLPSDTILCLRVEFSVANIFQKSSMGKEYKQYEELIRELLK